VEDTRGREGSAACARATDLDVDLVVLGLRANQVREVGVQQLKDDVDRIKRRPGRRKQDVMDGDDVGVLEQPQEAKLADDPDRVSFVGQHTVDMFDGNLFLRVPILCRTARHQTNQHGQGEAVRPVVGWLAWGSSWRAVVML
jgi:hypothetical protein